MDEEIEIKSEPLTELLSAAPQWIVRWGISIIFLIILLGLMLSVFIKYPDRLSANTIITTTAPPITMLAKTNGKIAELKIRDHQLVRKGDLLVVIESAANPEHVHQVAELLEKFPTHSIKIEDSLQMGTLTSAYLTFLKNYEDYHMQANINPQEKELEIIHKQLLAHEVLQSQYKSQANIYKEEFLLVQKDFNRHHTLFHNGFISSKEYEKKKQEYLSSKRNHESAEIAEVQNKIAINNLLTSKLQLTNRAYQENKKSEQLLNQSLQALKAEIKSWQQTYLIKAPIDGYVSLFNYWSINQNLKQGEPVLSIVPSGNKKIIAKLFLPIQNSGKLKLGQTVNIKVNNYGYQEYGTLSGKVTSISLMPQNGTYAIEVALPNPLITSYRKQLQYKEEMQGVADIITEELSVFERVFYQFTKALKK